MHRFTVVGDVLEDMGAQDEVEGVVFEGEGLQVGLHIDDGRFQVRRHVVEVIKGLETAHEAPFRREVEHLLRGPEEVGFEVQVEPDEPVSLEAAAISARSVGSAARTGTEFTRGRAANRTEARRTADALEALTEIADPLLELPDTEHFVSGRHQSPTNRV